MKEEALKLADEIDINGGWHYLTEASNMIRKLVAELDKTEKCLLQMQNANIELVKQGQPVGIIGKIGDCPIHDLVHRTAPQTKPLTDEEAMDIWLHLAKNYDSGSFATFFVREIEKRHGIK